jgi:predicted Zn-dependent protease
VESEADRIGFTLLHKAGFNLIEALECEKRSAAVDAVVQRKGMVAGKTHPSGEKRIRDIEIVIKGLSR